VLGGGPRRLPRRVRALPWAQGRAAPGLPARARRAAHAAFLASDAGPHPPRRDPGDPPLSRGEAHRRLPAMRRWHAAAVLLAAIVLTTYWPVLRAGFVFDDDTQILSNPQVRELRNFPRAITQPVWAFQHPDKGAYFRPVQM